MIALLGGFSARQGFTSGSLVENLPANAGDMGSTPGLGRIPGEGNGNPLQYCCLETPTDVMYIYITESLCCIPETNKILSNSYNNNGKSLELHPNNEKCPSFVSFF